MAALDFLFEGSPPPSTTTYGSTVENLPPWLADYTQGLIARANQVAGEGYQPYTGPRIAGITNDQANAFDIVRNNIGDWNSEMNSGSSRINSSVGTGQNMISGGINAAMPSMQSGAHTAGGALSRMEPYMARAGRSMPQAVGEYMSPYVGGVIDRATQVANRNWEENMMPGISARFIRGGQSGSTAHQTNMLRGARDVSEGLQSQAMAALDNAYQTAGSQFQADASRYANMGQSIADTAIRQGATVADIGQNMGDLQMRAGSEYGDLGLRGGQALQDAARQRQQMGLVDASALETIGRTQQQQNQGNLDLAYQDFQAQRNHPRDTVDWMSSVIRGMPTSRSTQTTSTAPYSGENMGPSGLSQLLSLYGLYRDATSGQGKARGGLITLEDGYADGGKVPNLRSLIAKMREAGPEKSREAILKLRSDASKGPPRRRGDERFIKSHIGNIEDWVDLGDHEFARGGLIALER